NGWPGSIPGRSAYVVGAATQVLFVAIGSFAPLLIRAQFDGLERDVPWCRREFLAPERRLFGPMCSAAFRSNRSQWSQMMSVGIARLFLPAFTQKPPLLPVGQCTVKPRNVTRMPPIAWTPSWWTLPCLPAQRTPPFTTRSCAPLCTFTPSAPSVFTCTISGPPVQPSSRCTPSVWLPLSITTVTVVPGATFPLQWNVLLCAVYEPDRFLCPPRFWRWCWPLWPFVLSGTVTVLSPFGVGDELLLRFPIAMPMATPSATKAATATSARRRRPIPLRRYSRSAGSGATHNPCTASLEFSDSCSRPWISPDSTSSSTMLAGAVPRSTCEPSTGSRPRSHVPGICFWNSSVCPSGVNTRMVLFVESLTTMRRSDSSCPLWVG